MTLFVAQNARGLSLVQQLNLSCQRKPFFIATEDDPVLGLRKTDLKSDLARDIRPKGNLYTLYV